MSEHNVHTAIVEDSFTIAQRLPQIPPDFKQVLQHDLDFARLGSITVAGDQFSFTLLEEYKGIWATRNELTEQKLAFVLGWISHRACDRTMKPIWKEPNFTWRGTDANPALSPTECSIYHEAEAYHLYFSDDDCFRCGIFIDKLEQLPGASYLKTDVAEAFVQSSLAMNLINIQTIPLDSPKPKYMEEICMRVQKFYVDINRYVNAIAHPIPELRAQYVTDLNWYSLDDKIIAAARNLRDGKDVSAEALETALAETPSSYYGKALRLSLGYFLTAAAYFHDDSMSIDMLKERLDIGKLGPDGLRV
ncbi:MAG: hypothetical protein DBY25_03590 [Clostridiales bacterium]|nr:MAG: hypothetical protein DBY25_03590 [Clostridiales bacterium]